MLYTAADVTYDSLSLHAVITPVACRKVKLRQRVQDVSTSVPVDVASPQATNNPVRFYAGEPIEFPSGPGTSHPAGSTVGYVQPTQTATFAMICEVA